MSESVVVVGVGALEGTGAAVAQRFAREGFMVWVVGRTQVKLQKVCESIAASGGQAEYAVADVTSQADIGKVFARVEANGIPIASVVYNAGNNRMQPFLEVAPDFFEDMWKVVVFGAFLTAQRAVPLLLKGAGPDAKRSLLFTGASASMRGRAGFAAFAHAKGGLRMLAQSLAREFGEKHLHVGHVVVDGVINGEIVRSRFPQIIEALGDNGLLNTADLADAFYYLHNQEPTVWTLEMDVRPAKEKF